MNLQAIMDATPLHHRLNGWGRTLRAERGELIPATRLRLRRIRWKPAATGLDMTACVHALHTRFDNLSVCQEGYATWIIIYGESQE